MPRAGKNRNLRGKSELCKGHGGICHGQKSQPSPLGCLLPSPPPLTAVRRAESSSWLWVAITDPSGTPAPPEGLGGIKGAFNFGRRGERLDGWTRGPFQPVARNPASSLHAFPAGTHNSHHPCSPQAGKMLPPSLGTCVLEQNREGKLKITQRSQQSSLIGFPPSPTAGSCLCKSLGPISCNQNRELFIQRRWRAGNGGRGLNTAQACPPRGGQTRCHPGVPRIPWGAQP